MQKGKMAVWGGLTNSCETKRGEKQRRKGKIHPFEYRVPKKSKENFTGTNVVDNSHVLEGAGLPSTNAPFLKSIFWNTVTPCRMKGWL